MAMMILGLLAGAVYSLATAALETSKEVKREHLACNRLDALLRVLRETFVNLSSDAAVSLNMVESVDGAPVPEIVLERAPGAFGVSSPGTYALVLAARPLADGTRELALQLRPGRDASFATRNESLDGPWIPLLAGVENVLWRFKRGGDEWVEEWPNGAGRPEMVRVTFEYAGMPGRPVDAQFWVPNVEPLSNLLDGQKNQKKNSAGDGSRSPVENEAATKNETQ
jgi:hypothetical protein